MKRKRNKDLRERKPNKKNKIKQNPKEKLRGEKQEKMKRISMNLLMYFEL